MFTEIEALVDGNILEVGTGPGTWWVENVDRIPSGVSALRSDFSHGMILEARERTQAMLPNLGYARLYAQAIPLRSESQDLILANHMIYHIPDKEAAFKEFHRILKPGASLCATANGRNHMQIVGNLWKGHLPRGFRKTVGPPTESGFLAG
jgi:ubiquinone/menaquinone biosynthesis C-methylase UbiE